MYFFYKKVVHSKILKKAIIDYQTLTSINMQQGSNFGQEEKGGKGRTSKSVCIYQLLQGMNLDIHYYHCPPKNKNMNPYIELAKLVLRAEENDYFEWAKVKTEQLPDGSEMLHIYLQEGLRLF